MRIPIEVREADGRHRRHDTVDVLIADPPTAADRRDLAGLIAALVLEVHDLDVVVSLAGATISVQTPHASVRASLPAALDVHTVRATLDALGLRWE